MDGSSRLSPDAPVLPDNGTGCVHRVRRKAFSCCCCCWWPKPALHVPAKASKCAYESVGPWGAGSRTAGSCYACLCTAGGSEAMVVRCAAWTLLSAPTCEQQCLRLSVRHPGACHTHLTRTQSPAKSSAKVQSLWVGVAACETRHNVFHSECIALHSMHVRGEAGITPVEVWSQREGRYPAARQLITPTSAPSLAVACSRTLPAAPSPHQSPSPTTTRDGVVLCQVLWPASCNPTVMLCVWCVFAVR